MNPKQLAPMPKTESVSNHLRYYKKELSSKPIKKKVIELTISG